jgi:hypothetical protein
MKASGASPESSWLFCFKTQWNGDVMTEHKKEKDSGLPAEFVGAFGQTSTTPLSTPENNTGFDIENAYPSDFGRLGHRQDDDFIRRKP